MTGIRDEIIAELNEQLDGLLEQFREYQEKSERRLAVEVQSARLSGQNDAMTLLQPVGAVQIRLFPSSQQVLARVTDNN